MTEVDFDELAAAATAEDEFEAQTKAALLKSEGIEAFVFPAARMWTGGVGLAAAANGVPVWVRRGDVEQARAVLRRQMADAVDVIWEEVDLGEREDTLPLQAPGHVPWLAKVGLALAAWGCVYSIGRAGDSIAAVFMPLAPFPAIQALIDYEAAFSIPTNALPAEHYKLRVMRVVISLISSGVYAIIVVTMYKQMVRGFDMIVRRQQL